MIKNEIAEPGWGPGFFGPGQLAPDFVLFFLDRLFAVR